MGTKPDIEHIPKLPGCYMLKNKQGLIIYVGKSKSLYNRVRQYFYPSQSPEYNKYSEMAKEVKEVEFITTDTEINALILECQLIKEHRPRYNSQLINTPLYHYLRIDTSQEYPAISIADVVQGDRGNYFGGYYDIFDAQNGLELLGGIWQTPVCGKAIFAEKDRPCLNHHIGKCCAPCGKRINAEQYRQKIGEIIGCFNGDFGQTLDRLSKEMERASARQIFETAAKIRESIYGLQRLKKRLKSLYTHFDDSQAYLLMRAYNEQCYSLFYIKNGIVLNRADFPNIDEPSEAELSSFIEANQNADDVTGNGAHLAACILEIRASKYYVPVDENASLQQTVNDLHQAFGDFITGEY